jgi:hypothetical protein
MNSKILGLLAVALTAGPIAAIAQTETLNYSEGDFSGNVTLSAPLPENGSNIHVSPSEFNFVGASYDSCCGYAPITSFEGVGIAPTEVNGEASFVFTTVNGRISAWDINIDLGTTYNSSTQLWLDATISNYGDSFTQGISSPACAPPFPISGCTPISVSSGPGVWTGTQVPEIDPASAAAGLTLLLGSLVVLRGRQRVQ